MRAELWQKVFEAIETYATRVHTARVAPELEPEKIRALLQPFNFEQPCDPLEAADFIIEGLWQHQVHTPHPRYFGLFNPAPTTMSIAADTLVAAFNPQLAAWSHSPLAAEIEQHLVRAFGSRFGYDPSQTDGTFTSGGAEANHTALLTALTRKFPQFASAGLRGLAAQPVLYISSEGHHSFLKAARESGLGTDSIREVPVDDHLRMDVDILSSLITRDVRDGLAPFMIVATAGTTNAGVIDSFPDIADVAAREGLWFHVDAAWGGAAALVPKLRRLLDGIERADSITFDAHKWLSVPMGAGLYLTRHIEVLSQTFKVSTSYMPREGVSFDVIDPFMHSMQWSRRFIGLKVFLSLVVAGWEGYEAAIQHQTAMGDYLRRQLSDSGWEMANETLLPVVCFIDPEHTGTEHDTYLQAVAQSVVSSGIAWISTTRLGAKVVLRACITNYRTGPEDVDALVRALDEART
jgi:glutamate/tyrosine decarboxylase-like PLP-dependent enzyme